MGEISLKNLVEVKVTESSYGNDFETDNIYHIESIYAAYTMYLSLSLTPWNINQASAFKGLKQLGR